MSLSDVVASMIIASTSTSLGRVSVKTRVQVQVPLRVKSKREKGNVASEDNLGQIPNSWACH